MAKFLAADEAYKAMFRGTPELTQGSFDSSEFSDENLISASLVSHRRSLCVDKVGLN